VKQKEKSMKAYGQLTPITVTDGEKVIQMGGRLVDLKGFEIPNEDAGKYYAVLDGQHRLVAYQNLQLDLNDLVICEPLNAELSITEVIAQMNICTTVWKKYGLHGRTCHDAQRSQRGIRFRHVPAQ